MSAKFHVDAVFSIEGRGTVLQGTIISGEISRGMLVKVPGGQSSRRVAAVEAIHGDCIPRQSLGLVLESGAPDDAKDFAALSEGKVLESGAPDDAKDFAALSEGKVLDIE